MNKKFKKIWDKMDDKTKESVKFLINELSQKKYQKLADESMKLQGGDKVIKMVKEQGEA
ncbi:hypothetical protein HOE22_06050 [Candidatus Woesearchaeota archaeon]|jgi:hypothetical protein|nr:hypothetical protein [Candidatus Woesearchaeota archaeon]